MQNRFQKSSSRYRKVNKLVNKGCNLMNCYNTEPASVMKRIHKTINAKKRFLKVFSCFCHFLRFLTFSSFCQRFCFVFIFSSNTCRPARRA